MQRMTGFQRVVFGLAAVAIALRVFFPVTASVHVIRSIWREQALLAPTILHVVGILVLAGAVFALFPAPNWRRLVIPAIFVATASLVALRVSFPVQTRMLEGFTTQVPLSDSISWTDRVIMTLGFYQTRQGLTLLPDWNITWLHVGVILLVAMIALFLHSRSRVRQDW